MTRDRVAAWFIAAMVVVFAGVLTHLAISEYRSSGISARQAAEMTGGDPRRGRAMAKDRGCGACHRIPGVDDARGLVGPPLDGFADRVYVAGMVPNAPDYLIAWIRDPQQINPRTAMPNVGLSAGEAQDIAAYLYTLK